MLLFRRAGKPPKPSRSSHRFAVPILSDTAQNGSAVGKAARRGHLVKRSSLYPGCISAGNKRRQVQGMGRQRDLRDKLRRELAAYRLFWAKLPAGLGDKHKQLKESCNSPLVYHVRIAQKSCRAATLNPPECIPAPRLQPTSGTRGSGRGF